MKSIIFIIIGLLTSIILNSIFDLSFGIHIIIVCVIAVFIYFVDERFLKTRNKDKSPKNR